MGYSALTVPAPETLTDPGFVRHRGPVTSVAVLPDQSLAVTAAYDGAVGLFDLYTGQAELLGYHNHLVNHVALNASGTRAASSSSDYEIHIWDIPNRRREMILRGHSDDVECFAFATDRLGVSCSRDRRVIVWDLTTGAIARIISEHEKDVISVVCAGAMIFSSGDDMTVRQWDLATGEMVRMWGPFEHETDTCAVDPAHGHVVAGCDDGHIRVFSLLDGTLIRDIPAHASGIKKVAVSPITGDILSAAYDQRIRIWSARTFEPLSELKSFPAVWERSLNWSPDGARIAGGTFDGAVALWNSADGSRAGAAAPGEGNCCFNEVSAAGNGDAAVVSDDGLIRMIHISPTDAALTATVKPATGRILMNAVTLDEASGLVVTGAHNHTIHIFRRDGDGLTGEIELPLGEGPINSIRVAHCPGYEDQIFVACYSGAIVRVSPDGRVLGKIHVHEGAVKALRIHPRKPLGVSCSADNSLLSWTLEGELVENFLAHTAIVNDVDFDPSGRFVASVSRDFTLKVFDLETSRMKHSVAIGRRSPKSVCFWDEKTVVIGDYWGALMRVDLNTNSWTRRQIARNGISSVSRSGAGVVASSYDGAVYLASAADLSVRNSYRAMLQRLVG